MLINIEELVGLTERSAVRKIENARLIARVISRDGVERANVSSDLSEDRVNLIVEEGEIRKAWLG